MNIPQPHPDLPDNHFENDERLFHALQKGHVMGNTVLPGAISLASNALSCNREKYRSFPHAVLAVKKPEDKYERVGFVLPGNLPPNASANGMVVWEFVVDHAPILENYSHAEVRAKQIGRPFNTETKINARLKLEMKASLAERMEVLPRYGPNL